MMKQEVVVIGLGNPLMSDEGIGIYLLEKLREDNKNPGVDYYDLGTSGTKVLHVIAEKRKAIFLDCALMGEEPGTIRRFIPEEVYSNKALKGFSLHEGDLLQFIELSHKLGECPEEIVIFGIEPQNVSQGRMLTPTLAAQVDEYIASISKELE